MVENVVPSSNSVISVDGGVETGFSMCVHVCVCECKCGWECVSVYVHVCLCVCERGLYERLSIWKSVLCVQSIERLVVFECRVLGAWVRGDEHEDLPGLLRNRK